jgi:Holliday junction resolvase
MREQIEQELHAVERELKSWKKILYEVEIALSTRSYDEELRRIRDDTQEEVDSLTRKRDDLHYELITIEEHAELMMLEDNDSRGYRGKNAENELIGMYSKMGWNLLENRSRGSIDIILQKGKHKKAIEIKKINEYVSKGNSKRERGRVQLSEKEVETIRNWRDAGSNRSATIAIKIKYEDGVVEWKRLTLATADKLSDGKTFPMKIPFTKLTKLPSLKTDMTISK